MGQKVHPHGYRLGITTDWNSKWYADSREFSKFLLEDIKVRDYLRATLKHDALPLLMIIIVVLIHALVLSGIRVI